jgi:N-acetylneuraminic acid mutarotase
MVIIGGWDRERHFQDWFELNLETNEWSERQVELPFPIGQHAMVSAKNMIVLFGGFDARTGSASNVLFTHKLGHLYHTASGGGN